VTAVTGLVGLKEHNTRAFDTAFLEHTARTSDPSVLQICLNLVFVNFFVKMKMCN